MENEVAAHNKPTTPAKRNEKKNNIYAANETQCVLRVGNRE